MNKHEFTLALRHALGKFPSYEVEQSIAFYSEMIEDRVEDGMSEEQAVAALGSVEVIAAQIAAETPLFPKALAKANTGSRSLNVILLAVFSPIWVPMALVLAMSAFAVYLSIWATLLALWLAVGLLILCGPIGLFLFVLFLVSGNPLSGTFQLGIGLAACGLGLFAWFGVLAASKGLVQLTHTFSDWISSLFKKQNRNTDTPTPNKGEQHYEYSA